MVIGEDLEDVASFVPNDLRATGTISAGGAGDDAICRLWVKQKQHLKN